MSSRKLLRITLLGFLSVVLFVAVMFLLRDFSETGLEVELPQTNLTPDNVAVNPEGLPDGFELLSVSPENVQSVIATLARPEAYSRDIIIESFWDGGSAVYSFGVSVRDGATALRFFSGGTAKNIIVTDERTYIWSAGDRRPITVSATENSSADDEFQMILTYEDILELGQSQIVEASLTAGDAGPGIFIRYASGELGYVTECTVSIELGLIISAEQYDGKTLVYRMSAGECSLEVPGITGFTLPNGMSVFAR